MYVFSFFLLEWLTLVVTAGVIYSVQRIHIVCSTVLFELQGVCSCEMTDARNVKHKTGQSQFEERRISKAGNSGYEIG